MTRGELRKALAELEKDGLIWRHVGRGTFIGARPVLNLADVAYLGELASPAQVIAARLVIEPELARLAAIYATRSDFDEIQACAQPLPRRDRTGGAMRPGTTTCTTPLPRRPTTSCWSICLTS